MSKLPSNLTRLYEGEVFLRGKSLESIEQDDRLLLHFQIAESVMDLIDVFRQIAPPSNEIKEVQLLSLRMFNSFAASINLMMVGYYQKSAMVLRDLLETTFLVDLFASDRQEIVQWLTLDDKKRRDRFRPAKVRNKLDQRDGFKGKARDKLYDEFCELAGHPTRRSGLMLAPKDMQARNGPFFDLTVLNAVASEMGRLAVQVGDEMTSFLKSISPLPDKAVAVIDAFSNTRIHWLNTYFPQSASDPSIGDKGNADE